MLDGSQAILSRPARRQRPSFVLTSLIDIIFLLVIFFMVTSQITPFSLLTLTPSNSQQRDSPTTSAAPPPVSLRILSGRVTIGGKSVPMSGVGEALTKLRSQGITTILLTPSSAATVQDVVTVLEAAKDAAIPNVTVISRRDAP
jgi:biopolymer transport protein ExbD